MKIDTVNLRPFGRVGEYGSRIHLNTLHAQDCFHFDHPNWDRKSNDRAMDLDFEIEVGELKICIYHLNSVCRFVTGLGRSPWITALHVLLCEVGGTYRLVDRNLPNRTRLRS